MVGLEAQAAVAYWDYVRFLLSDDEVTFEGRERKGAKDLFNSMLNYGYVKLNEETRKTLIEAITQRLQRYENYRGTEMTLEQVIQHQASEIGDFVADRKKFKAYLAKW